MTSSGFQAYLEGKMSEGCYRCYGTGCRLPKVNLICEPGYTGVLCSYCQEGYRARNTKNCEECPPDIAIWKLAVAAATCLMALALALWFWVFRPTAHGLLQETPSNRTSEFVEQGLMFLSYIQILKLGRTKKSKENCFTFFFDASVGALGFKRRPF